MRPSRFLIVALNLSTRRTCSLRGQDLLGRRKKAHPVEDILRHSVFDLWGEAELFVGQAHFEHNRHFEGDDHMSELLMVERRQSEQNGRLTEQSGEPRVKGTPPPATLPPRHTWIWFLALLFVNYLIVRFFLPIHEEPTTVPYTFFKKQVGSGNVGAIYGEGETITGRFIAPVAYPPVEDKSVEPLDPRPTKGDQQRPLSTVPPIMTTHFTTILPAFVDQGLEAFLIKNGVEISAKPIQEQASPFLTLFFSFGPGLLFIGFYIWLFRRAAQQGGGFMGGSLMSIGKSKARRYDQEKQTKGKFDDVAGIDEAENELVEIVDFLKDTRKYTRLGGTAPKGVLLIGAPGTGKTLLARAVAGEAGVPFFP